MHTQNNSLLNLAEIYCRKGKPREAISLCQEVIGNEPKNSDAYLLLGYSLGICGSFKESIHAYSQAISYDPENINCLLQLGRVYKLNNQLDEAIATYERVILIDENNICAYWMLGNLLKQKKQNWQAIAYHTKLLKLDWNAQIIEYDYEELVRDGHIQISVEYALQVLRRKPNEAQATGLINFLLNHLVENTKFQEAIQLAIRLLNHAPSLHLGYQHLSNIYLRLGHDEWARSCHMRNIPLEVLGDSSQIVKMKFKNDKHPTVRYINVYPEQEVYVRPSTPLNDTFHVGLEGSYYTAPEAYVAIVNEGRVWADMGQTSAVFTSDGFLLEDLSSGSSSLIASSCDLSEPRKINGRIAFLSIKYSGNYCHWTSDVLARISLLKRSNIDFSTIDYFVVSSCTLSFQRDALNLAGIPKEKIIESSKELHICASEVIVPSLPGHHPILPPWAIKVLREDWLPLVIDRVDSLPKKIYLTRTGVTYRKVTNEPELMTLLMKYGFSCITPSKIPVLEQIAILAAAEIVVSPHGAALTNAIFMNSSARIVELFPQNYMNPCYHIALSQLPVQHFSFFCNVPPYDPESKNTLEIRDFDNLYVDLLSFEKVLENLA